jgi:hypothetical protein
VDRSKLSTVVSESKSPTGTSFKRIPGRFSVCDCVNGNNRRYSRGSGRRICLPDHPYRRPSPATQHSVSGTPQGWRQLHSSLPNFPSGHQSNSNGLNPRTTLASQCLRSLRRNRPLRTPKRAKARGAHRRRLQPARFQPWLRLAETAQDGVDEVEEDYVCESWDVVIKPSFEMPNLLPTVNRLSGTTRSRCCVSPNPTAESKVTTSSNAQTVTIVTEQKTLKESTPSTGPAPPAPANQKQKPSNMEINELKSQINALRNTDPSKAAASVR